MYKILKFGVKAGIMSSAVYLTINKGVWKDNETTSELYEELKVKLKPIVEPVREQIPFSLPQLPKTGDFVSSAKTAWNKGVMASSLFLLKLPHLTWEYANRGTAYTYTKIKEQLQNLNEVKYGNENDSKNS